MRIEITTDDRVVSVFSFSFTFEKIHQWRKEEELWSDYNVSGSKFSLKQLFYRLQRAGTLQKPSKKLPKPSI